MLLTVKDACELHPMALEYSMSEQVENLSDVISATAVNAREFFAKNYVTKGMETLLTQGLRRLGGQSDQAVFELKQAMGGGKTHSMIALGLLARDAKLRAEARGCDVPLRRSGARWSWRITGSRHCPCPALERNHTARANSRCPKTAWRVLCSGARPPFHLSGSVRMRRDSPGLPRTRLATDIPRKAATLKSANKWRRPARDLRIAHHIVNQ
jgi:hypothetical protein